MVHTEAEIIFVEIQPVVWWVGWAWIHMVAGEYFGRVCVCVCVVVVFCDWRLV